MIYTIDNQPPRELLERIVAWVRDITAADGKLVQLEIGHYTQGWFSGSRRVIALFVPVSPGQAPDYLDGSTAANNWQSAARYANWKWEQMHGAPIWEGPVPKPPAAPAPGTQPRPEQLIRHVGGLIGANQYASLTKVHLNGEQITEDGKRYVKRQMAGMFGEVHWWEQVIEATE